MTIHLNMLGAFMKNRIGCNMDVGLIVTQCTIAGETGRPRILINS